MTGGSSGMRSARRYKKQEISRCVGNLLFFISHYYFNFLLFNIRLFADIDRTVLHFQIGFRQILSHNSHTKQLDSANACHDTYQRRPAGNRITEYQCAYDFRDDCNKRNHGEHQPQIRGNLQRNIRKIDNPINLVSPAERFTF